MSQEALAAETRIANCPPYVAVNVLDDVVRTPTMLRVKHPPLAESCQGPKAKRIWLTAHRWIRSCSGWAQTMTSIATSIARS
jgi:hypothetical protein